MEIRKLPDMIASAREHTDTAGKVESKIPADLEISGEQPKEQEYNREDINKEVDHLNKWLEAKNSHIRFVLHERLNEYYIQVINDGTNEVMKEIPSKKIMDIVANFYEKLGFIMDTKV